MLLVKIQLSLKLSLVFYSLHYYAGIKCTYYRKIQEVTVTAKDVCFGVLFNDVLIALWQYALFPLIFSPETMTSANLGE